MTFRRWQVLLACIVLAVAVPLAACGDDDDDDGETPSTTATAIATSDEAPANGESATSTSEVGESTPDVTETATEDRPSNDTATPDPGDDDTSTPLPTVDFDDEDASYAADLCGAFQGFYDSFQSAFLEVTPTDNPLDGFIEVFSDLRDTVDGIDPPDRYAEFHAQALAVYQQLVEDLEAGNPEPLTGVQVPEVSPDLQARLASAAAQDPVCQEVEEDFGTSLFGGE